MTYFGVDHARARRHAWERLVDFRLSGCEVCICIGGALLVGFIGVVAGGAFLT